MRARFVLAVVLMVSGLLATTTAAQATSLVVCPSGCPFDNIQGAVDAAGAGDRITIQAGTYAGRIILGKDISLIGSGPAGTVIEGGDPAVSVQSNVTVRIVGVTITRGSGIQGGGIVNSGKLTLRNVNVDRNTSLDSGAGIFNLADGNLTLVESNVTNNEVESVFGSGGGIDNHGTLWLRDSTISGNGATAAGGIENEGTLKLERSQVLQNSATLGGGIVNDGVLTVRNSEVTHNAVSGDPVVGGGNGAGIYNQGTTTVQNSQISGNNASADQYGVREDTGFGGGIYSIDGTVTVRNSTVSGNTADRDGGGIFSSASLTLQHAVITENTAGRDGGGIANVGGTVTLRSSVLRDNHPNDCLGC